MVEQTTFALLLASYSFSTLTLLINKPNNPIYVCISTFNICVVLAQAALSISQTVCDNARAGNVNVFLVYLFTMVANLLLNGNDDDDDDDDTSTYNMHYP